MTHSYFEQQCNFKVDYAPTTIKKWKSTRTNLQVTLLDQASPMVNGYFAVATEIMNDSGCPHTLEHLIFMGSKKYPYKGLLDILGNLAFSSTNAWTATDQTVYTLTTAGWEGFRMLLPVYLDHLFNPTLTDSACYTEVYHVDGEGKEKGVVYSEMQGIENQSWFIQTLESQRLLYKKSGYKSETGGLTKNLRTLDPNTIREYHSSLYRPDNLCIIITGSVDETEILDLMAKFDAELPSAPETPTKRPFVDTPQDLPLTESIVKKVAFPDKDESSGSIMICWIGPDSRSTVLDQAIDVLGRYLTSSSVSLFNQKFIEIEDPFATDTGFYTDSYVRTGMTINFGNIPSDKLESFPEKVFALLKEHCNEDQLDLVRLRDLVEQTMWKFVHKAEKSPETLAHIAIYEFEYGEKSGEDLIDYCKTLDEFKELLSWDISKWVEIFRTYYVDNHSVTVIATPSEALYKEIKAENVKILEDRKEKLGPEGLKKLEEKLEKAQAINNKEIPKEILDSFGRPDPSGINFITTESIAAGINKDIENSDSSSVVKVVNDTPKEFPMYIHFENYESNFVSIDLLFSSFELDTKSLALLRVFETLTSLPIEGNDGELIPYDDVVKQIKRDSISYYFGNSFNGRFNEFISLSMVVKNENYQIAIDWFIKLMFKTKFTKERVSVALNKLIKSLPETKRSGNYMLRYLYNKHYYTDRSLLKSSEILENETYLKEILAQIENGDFESIEKQLNDMREKLFTIENTRVVIFGDVNKIANPVSSWEKLVESYPKPSSGKLTDLPFQDKTLSELGISKSKKCFIITTPGSDSSYMDLVTSTPISEYTSEDAFKILLGAEYLQAVEGPFWRGIRGAGLAYGANCYGKTPVGELCYSIYRGADLEKSYSVAKKIVEDFASGKTPIDDSLRQGAVSSIVNKLTENQSNYSDSATSQFYDDILVKRGPNYNTKVMKALSLITNEDLVDIFNKYFINLFNSDKSVCFISCNPAKAEGIEKFFTEQKYEMDVQHIAVEVGPDGEEDYDGSERDDDSYDSEESGSSEEESDIDESSEDEHR
ncbi:hypothetical protein C6P40_003540 [Pichia californica]|uniref:Mitochondrial presequence protease n=1 Tax=Pichia californica TaxID=460514 RepID=A0A9P7BH98_9ASCO|nr:hypothetical protein C6P40_003540 [[Candida] californica]